MPKLKVKITDSDGKKMGRIYKINDNGIESEILRLKAKNFKRLAKELRTSGLIPQNAAIKERGVTLVG